MAGAGRGRQLFSAPGDRADGLGQSTSANLAGGVKVEAATAGEDTETGGCVPDVAFSPAPCHERVERQRAGNDTGAFGRLSGGQRVQAKGGISQA